MIKPGQVLPCGRITTKDGKLLAAGAIYLVLSEALRAHKFGWRIIAATCDKEGRAYYTVQRKAVAGCP